MSNEKGFTPSLSIGTKPLSIFPVHKNNKYSDAKQQISRSGKSSYSTIVELCASNWHYPELIYVNRPFICQRYDKQALLEVANG